jgi:hypothetical protein
MTTKGFPIACGHFAATHPDHAGTVTRIDGHPVATRRRFALYRPRVVRERLIAYL